jgi:hypothetical protein
MRSSCLICLRSTSGNQIGFVYLTGDRFYLRWVKCLNRRQMLA